jgi:anti-anti-sigma factor
MRPPSGSVGPRRFNVRRENAGEIAVLTVEGDVDVGTAPTFRKELESIPRGTSVVIDLCETPFMDSSGLRILLAASLALERRVHIACPPRGPVGRLFEVAQGASELLRVYDSRSEALAAF